MPNATDNKPAANPQTAPEEQYPTKLSVTQHKLTLGRQTLAYEARADWLQLRKKHRPLGKVFHVAYFLQPAKQAAARPLTFVFNGGPGAASAYLHMGALGPRRIVFGAQGTVAAPPAQVVDNLETWLPFTDLVFIDPIGTGFSRSLDPVKKDDAKGADDDKENPEYWEVDRDLESLGEFIQAFLSQHGRWTSPAFLAGESYGGYRVAKMARKLQEGYGVGLNGAILISPAIEFATFLQSDYDMTSWIETLPTMAAVAHFHGKCDAIGKQTPLAQVLERAETFAKTELLNWLARGNDVNAKEAAKTAAAMSKWIGIPVEIIRRANGRINIMEFSRNLLRDEEKLVGLYDGAVTNRDPYPNRDAYEGPDPTLMSIDRLFTAGINHHLRDTLKTDTELDYRLLSWQVNSAWKFTKDNKWPRLIGALDDLRYGMSLNPHMRVAISHGYYDLVTPYYSTNRLSRLMKLGKEQERNLVIKHYRGGHMFYSWDDSRQEFLSAMTAFYQAALGK